MAPCGAGAVCSAGSCAAALLSPPSGAEVIEVGAPNRIWLRGTVVTETGSSQARCWWTERTRAASPRAVPARSRRRASGPTIVETHGIILPGLIDTHNHILFDIFDESD
ncbi:MAG: hypothetical protein U0263_17520 [Polyangiaceae bacterium]